MTHDHLRDLLARTLHEAEDGPDCPREAKHRETYEPLADAILALVDVDEEWGLVWPTKSGSTDWFDSEDEAREHLEWRAGQVPDLAARTTVVHRWVLLTKPEEVTP